MTNGRTDLQSALIDATDGVDMSNVSKKDAQGNDLTRPKILISGKDSTDSGGDYTSGTLDLITERYEGQNESGVYITRMFGIEAQYTLNDVSDETTAKEIIREIERVLHNYRFNISHSYDYKFDFDVISYSGTFIADILITMRKYGVDAR